MQVTELYHWFWIRYLESGDLARSDNFGESWDYIQFTKAFQLWTGREIQWRTVWRLKTLSKSVAKEIFQTSRWNAIIYTQQKLQPKHSRWNTRRQASHNPVCIVIDQIIDPFSVNWWQLQISTMPYDQRRNCTLIAQVQHIVKLIVEAQEHVRTVENAIIALFVETPLPRLNLP